MIGPVSSDGGVSAPAFILMGSVGLAAVWFHHYLSDTPQWSDATQCWNSAPLPARQRDDWNWRLGTVLAGTGSAAAGAHRYLAK
jgi:fatty acid desaturase